MERYAGKPFLRLLECYVLKSIDKLDKQQLSTLNDMEPKLQKIYSNNESWADIVAEQMNLPNALPEKINDTWKNYSHHMEKQGKTANPNEFAVSFVDENFQT